MRTFACIWLACAFYELWPAAVFSPQTIGFLTMGLIVSIVQDVAEIVRGK